MNTITAIKKVDVRTPLADFRKFSQIKTKKNNKLGHTHRLINDESILLPTNIFRKSTKGTVLSLI